MKPSNHRDSKNPAAVTNNYSNSSSEYSPAGSSPVYSATTGAGATTNSVGQSAKQSPAASNNNPERKSLLSRRPNHPMGFSATLDPALRHTAGGVTATPNTGNIPAINSNLVVTDPNLRKVVSPALLPNERLRGLPARLGVPGPDGSPGNTGLTDPQLAQLQRDVQETAANLKAEFTEADDPDDDTDLYDLADLDDLADLEEDQPGASAPSNMTAGNHEDTLDETLPSLPHDTWNSDTSTGSGSATWTQTLLPASPEHTGATASARARSKRPESDLLKRRKQFLRSGWIPTEHGAYAMVLVPFWIGAGLAGICWSHFLLFLAWLVSYFAFFATTLWLRSGFKDRFFRPVQVYGLATGILGAITVVLHTALLEWGVVFLPLLAIAGVQAYRRKERSLLSRTATVAAAGAMCLVSYDLGTGFNRNFMSLSWLCHGGTILPEDLVVNPLGTLIGWQWAILVAGCISAYYWSTIFFVKSLVRKRNSRSFRYQSQAVHLTLLILMFVFQMLGWLRIWHTLLWLFIFAVSCLAPWWQSHHPKSFTVKRIGQFEVVLSIFVYLAILL